MPDKYNMKPYRIKARQRYEKRTFDKTLLRLPKGQLEAVKQAAKAYGESVNKYIVTAIERRMKSPNQ